MIPQSLYRFTLKSLTYGLVGTMVMESLNDEWEAISKELDLFRYIRIVDNKYMWVNLTSNEDFRSVCKRIGFQ